MYLTNVFTPVQCVPLLSKNSCKQEWKLSKLDFSSFSPLSIQIPFSSNVVLKKTDIQPLIRLSYKSEHSFACKPEKVKKTAGKKSPDSIWMGVAIATAWGSSRPHHDQTWEIVKGVF